jgi:hypothetical protein
MGFKELVYYKPYYEMLTMFCRDYEIYPDTFYEEVEGIPLSEQSGPEEAHTRIPHSTWASLD